MSHWAGFGRILHGKIRRRDTAGSGRETKNRSGKGVVAGCVMRYWESFPLEGGCWKSRFRARAVYRGTQRRYGRSRGNGHSPPLRGLLQNPSSLGIDHRRHSGACRNPVGREWKKSGNAATRYGWRHFLDTGFSHRLWIPACAGMTTFVMTLHSCPPSPVASMRWNDGINRKRGKAPISWTYKSPRTGHCIRAP